MRFKDLVAASQAIARSSGRLDKIEHLAKALQQLAQESPADIEAGVALLSGQTRQGRIGIGYAAIQAASDAPAANESTLTVHDVDAAVSQLSTVSGAGSWAERVSLLRAVFARATPDERDFLHRLLFGELRQGALEGVLMDGLARASDFPVARLRRAAMMAGGPLEIARAALTRNEAALDATSVRVMSPVQPMLAQSANDVAEAMATFGDAALEYKLDGARVQVHKEGDDVRVFTRTLNDVTASVPEVIEQARRLPARALILDGEVLALSPDLTPLPFQVTMKRFGRRRDVQALRAELPLTPFFFDCLQIDDHPLIDEPQERRVAALRDLAAHLVVPSIVRPTPDQAAAFVRDALGRGHEGVIVKDLAAAYAAGRRGAAWLKVKPARTLDLVILAAEWGHGRRQGWLSNLHLGARDGREGFVMLGKTFKGLTDQMLTWQTEHLLTLETGRDGHIVYVRPSLVVEIAFNELQASSTYPGGLALRFARVKRYRLDKTAAEADTIDLVREMARVR